MENLIGKPIRTSYIVKLHSKIEKVPSFVPIEVGLMNARVNREVQPINNSVSLSLAIELGGIR